jgi:hypothetical protein
MPTSSEAYTQALSSWTSSFSREGEISCGARSTLGVGKLGVKKLVPRIRTQPTWPQQLWHRNRRWCRDHELVIILAIK